MLRRRLFTILGFIVALTVFAVYVDLPGTPGFPITLAGRDFTELELKRGLDLQGGLHVVLQADLAEGEEITDGAMQAVRGIIENRGKRPGRRRARNPARGQRPHHRRAPGRQRS